MQSARLEHYLFVGRLAYNRGLEARIHWYKTSGKRLTCFEQCTDLALLRQADSFWRDVPSSVERDSLYRLDKAFKVFFRRVTGGKRPGFPRFKGHNRWNSFSISEPGQVVYGNRIRVVGVPATLCCRNLRPVQGTIKQQRIIRRAGKWYCQLVVDTGTVPAKPVVIKTQVGIDVGLTTFATLSNGVQVENPRFGKGLADKLAKAQRAVSRTKKNSRNHCKAVVKLQRVYNRITNQRKNFAHHLSKEIVQKYDLISVEALSIRNMVRGRFAKSIYDAAWGQFVWNLTYKAEEAGKTLVKVDPRGTSQECSGCHQKVPKELAVRTHCCTRCGLVLDRDHNAACNILVRGVLLLRERGLKIKVPIYVRPRAYPAPVGGSVMPADGLRSPRDAGSS